MFLEVDVDTSATVFDHCEDMKVGALGSPAIQLPETVESHHFDGRAG